MLTQNDITNLLADAYFTAAKAEAPMRNATEMLEELRREMSTQNDHLLVNDKLNHMLGRALDQPPLFDAIRKADDGYLALVQKYQREQILAAFAENETQGWQTWLQHFAEAISEWRDSLFMNLLELELPLNAEHRQAFELYQKHAPYVLEERWTESYPLFQKLVTHEFLPPHIRARIIVTCGQIELYHLLNTEKARQFFDEALALAPQESIAHRGLGEYLLKELQPEKARTHFQKALQLAPTDVEHMLWLGESYANQDKNQVALEWFQDALRKNPGNTNVYFSFIKICGKPEVFKDYGDEIPGWIAKITRLAPKLQYTAQVDAGSAYQANELYNQAEASYKKATEIEPERTLAWISLGNMYRLLKKYPESKAAYQKVMDIAAENFDGPWGYAMVSEAEGNWEEALQYYQSCLPLRPEWEKYVLDAIGEMQEKLNRLEEAQTTLLKSLAKDLNDSKTLESLHRIADTHREDGNWEQSIALLEKIRAIMDESYEPNFQNRVGIVYYNEEQYEQAIEHYQRAIDLKEEVAVYHENIGLAYEDSEQFELAERAFLRSCELAPDDPIINNRLGIFYYRRKNFEQAISYYREAIRLNPDYAVYHNNLGLALEAADDLETAEQAYQKAIELAPENSGYYNDLGVFYHNQGRYKEAIEAYDRAIELNADNELYLQNKGLALELSGKPTEALRTYERLADDATINHVKIAKLHLQNEQYAEAEHHAQEAIHLNPKDTLAYDLLAQAQEKQGKYAEAEQALRTAIDISEEHQDVFLNNLGLLFYHQQWYDQAISYYKQAIELRDDFALYFDNLGLAHERSGQAEEAKAAYLKTVQLEPDNPLYTNRLGTILYREGDFAGAKLHYEKTVALKPGDPVGHDNLGLALEALQDFEGAERAYQQALEVSEAGERDIYYNRLGIFCYRQGRHVEAIGYYRHAIECREQAVYYENLGLAYEMLEKWEEAGAAYHKAVDIAEADDMAGHQNRLGVYYYKIGESQLAIEHYQRAIQHDAEPAVYYENLALAFEAIGDSKNALQAYRQALERSPSEPLYTNKLGLLYLAQEDYESAEEYFKKTIALKPNDPIGYENLATTLNHQGLTDQALAWMQQAWEHSDQKDLYHNLIGNLYYQSFEDKKAAEQYRKAIELNPTVPIYFENLALITEGLGNYDEAINAIEKVMELQPDNPNYINRLGQLYYRQDKFSEALPHFKRATQINPNNAYFWENVGLTSEKLNLMPEAESAYLRALAAAAPEEKHAYHNLLGVFYYTIGETQSAIDAYRQALQLQPENSIYHENLGSAYVQMKDFEAANQAWHLALQYSDNEKDRYYHLLGRLYLEQYDDDRALEYFEQAIVHNPDKLEYYDSAAFVYEQKQRWDQAIATYEKALLIAPDNPVFYNRIGNVRISQEHFDAALEAFFRAVQLEPANSDYLENLLYTCTIVPDKGKALGLLRQLLNLPNVNVRRVTETIRDLEA